MEQSTRKSGDVNERLHVEIRGIIEKCEYVLSWGGENQVIGLPEVRAMFTTIYNRALAAKEDLHVLSKELDALRTEEKRRRTAHRCVEENGDG